MEFFNHKRYFKYFKDTSLAVIFQRFCTQPQSDFDTDMKGMTHVDHSFATHGSLWHSWLTDTFKASMWQWGFPLYVDPAMIVKGVQVLTLELVMAIEVSLARRCTRTFVLSLPMLLHFC